MVSAKFRFSAVSIRVDSRAAIQRCGKRENHSMKSAVDKLLNGVFKFDVAVSAVARMVLAAKSSNTMQTNIRR